MAPGYPGEQYEYEERAFFEEDALPSILAILTSLAHSHQADNKTSYFFVLPDVNVSIASSPRKTVVKYKDGQLGQGNGFVEHEFAIDPAGLPEALKLFSALLQTTPQLSEQFRINYDLGQGTEAALKYTQMWGFHLEFEKVYTAASDADRHAKETSAHTELTNLAGRLGVRIISDAAMAAFKEQCKRQNARGAYSPQAFRAKYGQLFAAQQATETTKPG